MTVEKEIAELVYNEIRTAGLLTGVSVVTDKENKIIDTKGNVSVLNLEAEELMELINNGLKVLKNGRKSDS